MVLGALKAEPEEREEIAPGIPVFATSANVEDISLNVQSQGRVEPRRQVTLAPQVSGRVTFVSDNLVNGGFVRRGQLLIKLEDADYKLALVRAESSVASAKQGLIQMEAEADLARRELIDLGIENASPLALKEPQLAEARASVLAAEAQLQDAQLQLKRTAIYAPFEGVVSEENVDVGQFVATGSMIGTIFGTDIAEVELQISSDELGQLGLPIAFNATNETPGPAVILSTDVGGKVREWIGAIVRTGASIDTSTRLVSIFAQVPNPFDAAYGDAPLAPGLYVDATVRGRDIDSVMSAPRSTLRGLDEIYVVDTIDFETWETNQGFALDEDTEISESSPDTVDVLRIRKVDVVSTNAQKVFFTGGISLEDKIITSPIQGAKDGMRVRVIERNASNVPKAIVSPVESIGSAPELEPS